MNYGNGSVGAVNELESWGIPLLSKEGWPRPQERPGWLLSDKEPPRLHQSRNGAISWRRAATHPWKGGECPTIPIRTQPLQSRFQFIHGPRHSYRSASMGLRTAALYAGYIPKIKPVPTAVPKPTATQNMDTSAGKNETSVRTS